MVPNQDNAVLRHASWQELERLIDRFEEAWQQGQQPDIDDYLPADREKRRVVLVELVHTDLERRLTGGDPARVETYLERYPELAEDAACVRELVAVEFELRNAGEPGLDPAEYRRRFPRHSAGLPEAPRPAAATPLPVTTAGAAGHGKIKLLPAGLTPPGYEIVTELGRGGMGVVYQARQAQLDRWVALKMILSGAEASPQERARFQAEAEAVARLQHPNIVQIHEAGEHAGQLFLALEFVTGGSLASRLTGSPLPAVSAAELIATLARAVHHAHERGIVHRDLKPGNILLRPTADGVRLPLPASPPATSAEGTETLQPLITDFGLAKRLDGKAPLTQSGALIGTPSYMAPEQVAGAGAATGPAVDIYALGAILYELLTGRPPFRAATPLETLDLVRTHEPVPPRRLQPRLPRDLEIICLKCLAKDPRRRYRSALALAEDLDRFTSARPIHARATPSWEKAVKWVRRRPAVAVLALAVVLTASLGFAAVAWQWQQTLRGLNQAETNLYHQRIALADREWRANHVDRARQLLAECPSSLRGWEWHYLWRLCHAEQHTLQTGGGFRLAISPSSAGPLLAVACTEEQAVQLWDLTTRQRLWTFPGSGPAVAFSPDGRYLASATYQLGKSGELIKDQGSTVTIWETATGKEIHRWPGHAAPIYSIAFNPTNDRIATSSLDRTIKVWSMTTGKEVFTYRRHTAGVESIAFSPNGQWLASADADGSLRVWNPVNGGEALVLAKDDNPATRLQPPRMKPDSGPPTLPGNPATAPKGTAAQQSWDVAVGEASPSLRNQTHYLHAVAFSPDSRRVAVSRGNSVRIWDVFAGKEVLALHGHTDLVRGLAFNRDGKRLASAGYNQSIKVWDPAAGTELFTLRGHTAPVNDVVFSPDDRQLVSLSWDGTVKLWNTRHGPEVIRMTGHTGLVRDLAFSPDGLRIATAGADRLAKIWDTADGQESRSLSGHAEAITSVAFSPDNALLAVASQDKTMKLWSVAKGTLVQTFTGHADKVAQVVFRSDGQALASASHDGTVRVWDIATGKETTVYRGHSGRVLSVAFRPDGKALASAGEDRVVHIWDAAGVPLRTLAGHDGDITRVTYAADGSRLASASLDRTVAIWNAEGHKLATLLGHAGGVTGVIFTPDGRRLATASLDRGIKIWDAVTGQELLTLHGPTSEMLGITCSADGRRLAVSGVDGSFYLWDAAPPTVAAPVRTVK